MNQQPSIVPPRVQWKTRRIICRPRARFCFRLALVFAAISILTLPQLIGAEMNNHVMGTISAVFCASALATGVTSLAFRLKESPREVTVRIFQDPGGPPVLHAAPRSLKGCTATWSGVKIPVAKHP
jgi:hypothetical protein